MSQLDLVAELRAHRPVAPVELRERVRDLAATAPAPKRRFTWRRALVVAIAVAGLAAVAGGARGRDTGQKNLGTRGPVLIPPAPQAKPSGAAATSPPVFAESAADSAAASGGVLRAQKA